MTTRSAPTAPSGAEGYAKNSYISFQAGSAGVGTGLLLTIEEMPSGYTSLEGDEWWITPHDVISEASGTDAYTGSPPMLVQSK